MPEDLPFQDYKLFPITAQDKRSVWEMRNSDFVRQAMVHSDPIPYEDHEKWFSKILGAKDSQYYLCSQGSEHVGVVGFFNIKAQLADWSFYLKDDQQPKGLGGYMCRMALDKVFKSGAISTVKTKILKDNKASIHLHQKLGFKRTDNDTSNNFYVFELQKDEWLKNNPD